MIISILCSNFLATNSIKVKVKKWLVWLKPPKVAATIKVGGRALVPGDEPTIMHGPWTVCQTQGDNAASPTLDCVVASKDCIICEAIKDIGE
jgi:hypothetical protein